MTRREHVGRFVMAKSKKRKTKVKKAKRATSGRKPKAKKTKRQVKKAVRKTKPAKAKKPAAKKSALPQPKTYKILMMGAAYGSLLAAKMLFGGHRIHHVCLLSLI